MPRSRSRPARPSRAGREGSARWGTLARGPCSPESTAVHFGVDRSVLARRLGGWRAAARTGPRSATHEGAASLRSHAPTASKRRRSCSVSARARSAAGSGTGICVASASGVSSASSPMTSSTFSSGTASDKALAEELLHEELLRFVEAPLRDTSVDVSRRMRTRGLQLLTGGIQADL